METDDGTVTVTVLDVALMWPVSIFARCLSVKREGNHLHRRCRRACHCVGLRRGDGHSGGGVGRRNWGQDGDHGSNDRGGRRRCAIYRRRLGRSAGDGFDVKVGRDVVAGHGLRIARWTLAVDQVLGERRAAVALRGGRRGRGRGLGIGLTFGVGPGQRIEDGYKACRRGNHEGRGTRRDTYSRGRGRDCEGGSRGGCGAGGGRRGCHSIGVRTLRNVGWGGDRDGVDTGDSCWAGGDGDRSTWVLLVSRWRLVVWDWRRSRSGAAYRVEVV